MHGLSYHTSVTSAAVYGGVEMGIQERALRAGVDIIVATPGRLMDHMRQQNADLSGIELLVLDEADRMMDMGFWPDVRRIISSIPNARQTLLFSATMPDDVVRFALEIVRDATFIQVGERSAPPKSITPDRGDAGVGEARVAHRLLRPSARPQARVHAHEDRRRSARPQSRDFGYQGRRAARQPHAGAAACRRGGISGWTIYGAHRDRHRGSRPRYRRHQDCNQLEVPDLDAYIHRVGRLGDRTRGSGVIWRQRNNGRWPNWKNP
jgi:ATP-dependent RNA helicase RhlE